MNEPGNENVRIGGVADELEQNPDVPVSGAELVVGKQYRLGSYQSRGDCDLVTVTSLDPSSKGWYDDHQGGGWMSGGIVTYTFEDGAEGWDACEYAEEFWTESDDE